MHFLRKESEWLHERDYGNKAAASKHIVSRPELPPRRITTDCAGLEKLQLNKRAPKRLSLSLYNGGLGDRAEKGYKKEPPKEYV